MYERVDLDCARVRTVHAANPSGDHLQVEK